MCIRDRIWLGSHFGVVYLEKIAELRKISIPFDHFWGLCDRQHCLIGLAGAIWIEPSTSNIHMLVFWPENHFGVVSLKQMVKIRISLLRAIQRATLLSWASVGDMDWVKSLQHPYAFGSIWEPFLSRIPGANGKSSNDSGYFDHFWGVRRTTLIKWAAAGI